MSEYQKPVLPAGYAIERNNEGYPILLPPENVTIFSEPGEGWLITDDFLVGRDWNCDSDCIAACVEYLAIAQGTPA